MEFELYREVQLLGFENSMLILYELKFHKKFIFIKQKSLFILCITHGVFVIPER